MSTDLFYVLLAAGVLLLLAALVAAVVLGLRVYRTGKYLEQLGAGGKFAFWGALIYTISPIDLLPDPIYLDDVGVLGVALFYLTRLAAKAKQRQQQGLPPGLPSVPQLQRRPPQRTR